MALFIAADDRPPPPSGHLWTEREDRKRPGAVHPLLVFLLFPLIRF